MDRRDRRRGPGETRRLDQVLSVSTGGHEGRQAFRGPSRSHGLSLLLFFSRFLVFSLSVFHLCLSLFLFFPHFLVFAFSSSLSGAFLQLTL